MNKSLLWVCLAGVGFLIVTCFPVQAEPLKVELPTPPKKVSREEGRGHVHYYLKSVGPGEAPHAHTVVPAHSAQISEIAMGPSRVPAPTLNSSPKTVRVHLETKEGIASLADGTTYLYWTFNGTVPGPMLRARVGDTVELTVSNPANSTHDHSIDLHAVTGPGGGGGVSRVAPGKSKIITFKAEHPGVFVYHCATSNVPTHITRGMYGLIAIDPKEGWPPVDREFYVMQGEIYTEGGVGEKGFQAFSPRKMMDERPEYFVLNGRVKALTGAGALQAKQGERIRIFFGNGGVSRISSFHIIGEIFDKVYPEAALNRTLASVQTTLVPAGGATVVELTLENSGDYVLLDHAISRIDRGGYGILHVEGIPVPELLSPVGK